MKIVDIFGDGGRFPNGWHRYIETHIGTKWVTLLQPNKLRSIRVRKHIYDNLTKKETASDWRFYKTHLMDKKLTHTAFGRRFAEVETNKVLNWIEENQ